jgi:hypothetical protein
VGKRRTGQEFIIVWVLADTLRAVGDLNHLACGSQRAEVLLDQFLAQAIALSDAGIGADSFV